MIGRHGEMENYIRPVRTTPKLRRPNSYQRLGGAASSVATSHLLGRSVLAQVLLCALPASGLLATGHVRLAGICFWTVLCVTLLRLALLGRCDVFLSLLVSLTPVIMLLRDFAKYNIVLALWAVGLLYYYSRSAETVLAAVRRCRPAVGLFVYVSVYYVFSLLFTREYSINLPMVEVVFVVAGILVLGRRRALLSAALQGFIVCACAVGIAMMPYIESSGRLGMVNIEGYRLGNPSQLGGSLALGLLALALDRGRWLHLERRPIVLFGSMAVTIAILYLTTSRGSWLVVAAGSLVAWLVGRGQRIRLLLVVAMFAVTLPTLLLTRYGPGVQLGLERTLGEDQSLRKRTSGRSDQWVVAYSAFTSSLGSVVYGHGPGMGRAVYAAESLTVPGVGYAVGREEVFHSLFMQVAVEAGVLGLAPLVVWLALILYRAINWVLRYREVFPLAAGVGYLCIGATVGAQGTIAGVFVGVALLASVRSLTPDGAIRGRSARRRRDSGHVDTETTA